MIDHLFTTVLENYLTEKQGSLTNNRIASTLRTDIPDKIKSQSMLGKEYLVQGSPGQGNWAEIPWVCVFDRVISKSATRGYYIVYLFSSDMSGVYISLNQGWTQYEKRYGIKEGRVQIQRTAKKFQNILRTPHEDFSFAPINLNAKNTLGKGYELGHICGKYYSRDNIPDDPVLINDFRNLLSVYREIKGIIGTELFDLGHLNDDDNNENEPSETEKIQINKRIAQAMSDEEIEQILQEIEEENSNKEPKLIARHAKAMARNPRAAELIKKKAKYVCQICGELGFEKENGERYAEVHHKQELAKSGLDIPSNMICICPRCHRILHYGSSAEIDKLKLKL